MKDRDWWDVKRDPWSDRARLSGKEYGVIWKLLDNVYASNVWGDKEEPNFQRLLEYILGRKNEK